MESLRKTVSAKEIEDTIRILQYKGKSDRPETSD